MAAKHTASLTITGVIGPGRTVTAQALTGVTRVDFEVERSTIEVSCDQGNPIYDYDPTATVTYVITGNNAVITIS